MGSIDLAANEEAHANILVELSESWAQQQQQVSRGVEEALAGQKVDAVLCVAGGWAGGNAASKGTVNTRTQDAHKECTPVFHLRIWYKIDQKSNDLFPSYNAALKGKTGRREVGGNAASKSHRDLEPNFNQTTPVELEKKSGDETTRFPLAQNHVSFCRWFLEGDGQRKASDNCVRR